MATSTVEDYIKAIYLECRLLENDLLPLGRLAQVLKVVPGTATTMVKSLFAAELVHYESRVGVKLSEKGEILALHVLRRHRLVESFLVDILKMDWSEIHEEAEEMEHVISDRVLEKIDELLGHPQYDPHGDPIPTTKGEFDERDLHNLISCAEDQELKVGRIMDQEPAFLQFVEKNGLRPGMHVMILRKDSVAEVIALKTPANENLTIGYKAASKIEVEK